MIYPAFKLDYFCFLKFTAYTKAENLSPIKNGIFWYLKTVFMFLAFVLDIVFLSLVFLFYFSKFVVKRADKRVSKTTDKATDFVFKKVLAPTFKIVLLLGTVFLLYITYKNGLLMQFIEYISDTLLEYFAHNYESLNN